MSSQGREVQARILDPLRCDQIEFLDSSPEVLFADLGADEWFQGCALLPGWSEEGGMDTLPSGAVSSPSAPGSQPHAHMT